MRPRAVFVALALVVAAAAVAACARPAEQEPRATRPPKELPELPAAEEFVSRVDNPYFPLEPGSVRTYEGVKDGEPVSETVTVTRDAKTILGVACTVVHDQLRQGGRPIEDTFDWYAQDVGGDVWYFGEDTRELRADGSVVTTEGSWEAGVDGARPGIVMKAENKTGDTYLQEYYREHAEDRATVVSTDQSVTVPVGSFTEALKTRERTRLEPDVVGEKYYARGIGLVREVAVSGEQEELSLTAVRR